MVSVFSGSSPRVGIFALRLSRQIKSIYAIIADMKWLGKTAFVEEMYINGKTYYKRVS
jgi:hypothetical protein